MDIEVPLRYPFLPTGFTKPDVMHIEHVMRQEVTARSGREDAA